MPAVCVCDCGFTIDGDGQLCLDWAAAGMKRVCSSSGPYSAAPAFAADWIQLLARFQSWTNNTCRTHRVIARLQIPWVFIRVEGGNTWFVRTFIDGAVDGPSPYDPTRRPELQWSNNWYLAMPANTTSASHQPGAAEIEFIVPPGSTLNVNARTEYMSQNYNPRPLNLIDIAPMTLSLSAWPSNVDTGSGRIC